MPLHVDVVAAERSVLSEDVEEVLANTLAGQIGVLPHHAPLLTLLAPGELRLRRGTEEIMLAVGGGFLEVDNNQVVVLADSAERSEEIDIALARSLARLRVAERTRRRSPRPQVGTTGVSEAGIAAE